MPTKSADTAPNSAVLLLFDAADAWCAFMLAASAFTEVSSHILSIERLDPSRWEFHFMVKPSRPLTERQVRGRPAFNSSIGEPCLLKEVCSFRPMHKTLVPVDDHGFVFQASEVPNSRLLGILFREKTGINKLETVSAPLDRVCTPVRQRE